MQRLRVDCWVPTEDTRLIVEKVDKTGQCLNELAQCLLEQRCSYVLALVDIALSPGKQFSHIRNV